MCALYYKDGNREWLAGKFKSFEQAVKFWELVKERVRDEYGSSIEPIFVETKQGRR